MNTCGKRRIATREEATRILASIWRAKHPGKMPVRAYKCEACFGKWHLTSMSLADYRAELLEASRSERLEDEPVSADLR